MEMWVHLLHGHILDTMVILEEGKLPHPRCPRLYMLVPRRTLNGRHPATAQCVRGAEQRRQRLAEAELRKITERAFEAYGELLENITAFKCLVQVLTAGDDDPGGGGSEGVRTIVLSVDAGGIAVRGGDAGVYP